MACFTVPLAVAATAAVAKPAIPAPLKKNPFVARLDWLGKMMFGGSFLLAIEHVWHGEIIFTPPFLTAVRDGDTAGMLHEMATRGVAMAVVIVAVWSVMVAVSVFLERKAATRLASEGV